MIRITALVFAFAFIASDCCGDEFDGPYLGFSVVSLDAASQTYFKDVPKLPAKSGVVIATVDSKGIVKTGVLSTGTIITALGKSPIATLEQFEQALEEIKPGSEVAITCQSLQKGRFKPAKVRVKSVKYGDYLLAAAGLRVDDFSKTGDVYSPYGGPLEKDEIGPRIVASLLLGNGKPSLKIAFLISTENHVDTLHFKTDNNTTGDAKILSHNIISANRFEAIRLLVVEHDDSFIDDIANTSAMAIRSIDGALGEDLEIPIESIGDVRFLRDLKRYVESPGFQTKNGK